LKINNEDIKSKLLGKFNAYNLLAIFSTAKLLGFDMSRVKKILETIEPPKGRFDYFISKNEILGIVDFAHTPDALEKVLLTIKEFKNKESKIITVVGCGGDRDPLKRRIMGKIGATFSDIVIFTADNPRSEDVEKIIAEMKTDLTMNNLKKVKSISDRHDAIIEAVKEAKKGDIILCAGKGHESYQEIKGVKHHFNDMEELKKNLLV
jgi:UDP-N-acetylmuramoyl-L-alanyl-D-glutamate--2,6-diaminopimelate ligase